jgi:hypothetical protein
MANNLKLNPVGVDKEIADLQTSIYNQLGYSNIEGYGRCYLIKDKNQKLIPAHFVKGKDYVEVLPNDKNSSNGHFFFMTSEKSKFEKKQASVETDIYFLLNIEKLKPGILHRADEEVLEDIIGIIEKYKFFSINEFVKGEKALEDFKSDLLDMQPYFFLKITGTIKYQFNC